MGDVHTPDLQQVRFQARHLRTAQGMSAEERRCADSRTLGFRPRRPVMRLFPTRTRVRMPVFQTTRWYQKWLSHLEPAVAFELLEFMPIDGSRRGVARLNRMPDRVRHPEAATTHVKVNCNVLHLLACHAADYPSRVGLCEEMVGAVNLRGRDAADLQRLLQFLRG